MYTDDELVASDILENALGDILELNADFHLRLVKSCTDVGFDKQPGLNFIWREQSRAFASFQDERDALPARIVNPEGGGSESWADRIARDGVIVEVAWLSIGRDVLTEKRVISFNGGNGPKHFDLYNTLSAGVIPGELH